MHQITVVKYDHISAIPFVDIYKCSLRQVPHQLVQQFRTIAIESGAHSSEGAVDPIHLPAIGKVQSSAASYWMESDQRLKLRPFMSHKRGHWPLIPYIFFRAPGTESGVNAEDAFNARFRRTGQCIECSRTVSE